MPFTDCCLGVSIGVPATLRPMNVAFALGATPDFVGAVPDDSIKNGATIVRAFHLSNLSQPVKPVSQRNGLHDILVAPLYHTLSPLAVCWIRAKFPCLLTAVAGRSCAKC